MKKLLVICGPTATGKTSLAIRLAKKFNAEIISSDSRQVYKGMDIGTGKDLPKSSKFKYKNSKLGGYYLIKGVRVWGYDLVEVGEEFSVAQYVNYANEIIENILQRGRLPVLVGGTGLYIKGVVNGIDTAQVPKNKSLRNSLKNKDTPELFEILASFDPTKAASMNISDRRNPRRLVRAIEIAEYGIRKRGKKKIKKEKLDVLFIGLTAPRGHLFGLIGKRISTRLKAGQEGEVKKLTLKKVPWDSQAMSALGYRQWRDFFERKKGKEEVIDKWKKQEFNFAKRQIAWFKRDRRINWFDITQRDFQKEVEKLVKKWYSSNRNGIT